MYFKVLSESLGPRPPEPGGLLGVRYVIAVAAVRYKAPSTSKNLSIAP